MNIVSYDFEFLKNATMSFESEKRFKHTEGVMREAYELGLIFMPDLAQKLSLAGLLHDITKDFSTEKQLSLCQEYGFAVDTEHLVPKLLHAKTGCEFAKRLFGEEIVDDQVYSGIYYHTTGRSKMTLFEAIIYLADYIEPGRTFGDCIRLREFFYDGIKNAASMEEKFEVLRQTMVLSFDMTISNLIEEGKAVDYDTVEARNYFLLNKNVFNTTEE